MATSPYGPGEGPTKSVSVSGHKYAIDAMVAATARHAPGPVTVLTSDTEDMRMLCGAGVAVVKV